MARQGLTPAAVTAAAAQIADADGLAAVTLARVAAALGVRAPSLYNHVDGLDALRREIALVALADVGAAMREAATGRARHDALVETARAYRAYVLAHPGQYAATAMAPPSDDEALVAAASAVVDVLLAVLRGWDLEGDDAIHAVRGLRSAIHGFVSLETEHGFGIPLDLDESFDRMVDVFARGLDELATGAEH